MQGEEKQYIAGVDEVGRGCLAGPVMAAIVILGEKPSIEGLTDSKKLSNKKRHQLALAIKQQAVAWSLGRVEASEIDRINIHQATLLAMRRAFDSLQTKPVWVKVDGRFYPNLPCKGETIVGGDNSVVEISAASIIAKVARDDEMETLDLIYPGYGFAKHKGYPTREHLASLAEHGPCDVHRYSYAPVKALFQS